MKVEPQSKLARFVFWIWRSLPSLALAGSVLVCTVAYGIQDKERKIKTGSPPDYPELAQKNGIKGMARVKVTVAPDGTVTEVQELGGNPLLVEALARAVKKWKYEPAHETTVLEVKRYFGPQ